MSIKRTVVDIAGERISCMESSGDQSTVVFCHSNSTSAAAFGPLLNGPIGAKYHCIAIDFPGHGESAFSAHPERVYSIPGLATLLVQLLSESGWQACAMVGHSLGGHVMIEALERLPAVRGIMLVGAPPLRLAELSQAYKPDPTDGLLFAGELATSAVQRFARALTHPSDLSAAMLDTLQLAIARSDPDFRSQLGQSLANGQLLDERAIASRSQVPIALVYGTDDAFIRPEYYASVKLQTPWGDGLFPFARSGHSPHLESSQAFQELLAAFLRSCASATP